MDKLINILAFMYPAALVLTWAQIEDPLYSLIYMIGGMVFCFWLTNKLSKKTESKPDTEES